MIIVLEIVMINIFIHLIIYVNNDELVNFTISDKSMSMYELNVARENGFIFNQINNF